MSEYIGEYIVNLTDKLYTDLRAYRREEITRCRDCERSEETPFKWFCHRSSMFDSAGFPVEPDGFCAWGVRRDA